KVKHITATAKEGIGAEKGHAQIGLARAVGLSDRSVDLAAGCAHMHVPICALVAKQAAIHAALEARIADRLPLAEGRQLSAAQEHIARSAGGEPAEIASCPSAAKELVHHCALLGANIAACWLLEGSSD